MQEVQEREQKNQFPSDPINMSTASQILGVSMSLLSRLVKEGTLQDYRRVTDKKQRFFSRGEVEALKVEAGL